MATKHARVGDLIELGTCIGNGMEPGYREGRLVGIVHRPEREIEAKRRIVDLGWHHLGDEDYGWGMEEAKRQILAIMALPYADHPDYDAKWSEDQ